MPVGPLAGVGCPSGTEVELSQHRPGRSKKFLASDRQPNSRAMPLQQGDSEFFFQASDATAQDGLTEVQLN